ncbi:MAG: translation initiation factor IF-2 subunit beta [Euryarchaeota archaeon]|nr:translation initiation factor IF-2 subunit beta [Euryarchaeota archaeon]
MMASYEQLLDRAFSRLPETATRRERFEVPQVQVQREGTKTILKNFADICDRLNREAPHLMKFFVGVVGTKGAPDGPRLSLTGSFTDDVLQRAVATYVKDFVMCPSCNRPDTHLIKEERLTYLRCDACGAKHVRKNL